MSIDISEKDKELLYELSINCRQSLGELAKKLRSKKTVIAYRIKRLENLGIIKGYYTLVDSFLLGYDSYKIYFNFQNLNREIEAEITSYFVKEKNTYFIASLEGRFDLVVCRWVRNAEEFYLFFMEMMRKYRNYIMSYVVTPYQYVILGNEYLTKKAKLENRTEWKFSPGKIVNADKMDLAILQEISYNAKATIVEIGSKLNITPNAIKYRIKNLKNLGVIKGFRADIDFDLLGYDWSKVDINLNDYEDYDNILNFIKFNSNTFAIDKSIGLADVESEFHYESKEELKSFLDELASKFPKSIKNYSYFLMRKVYKMNFMPETSL